MKAKRKPTNGEIKTLLDGIFDGTNQTESRLERMERMMDSGEIANEADADPLPDPRERHYTVILMHEGDFSRDSFYFTGATGKGRSEETRIRCAVRHARRNLKRDVGGCDPAEALLVAVYPGDMCDVSGLVEP